VKLSKLVKFLRNFPLGFCCGAISTFTLCWVIDSAVADQAIKNWTYLATAFVSILAASFAMAGVLATIENTRRIAEDARNRKLAASRASLPLALSELIDVCEARTKFTLTYDISNRPPSLSGNSIQILRECIEFSDLNIQDAISEVILVYQILISRDMSCHIEAGSGAIPINHPEIGEGIKFIRLSAVVDWQALICLSMALFGYARGTSVTVDRDSVGACLIERLDWLNLDGWLLQNDPTFRKMMSKIRERGCASFACRNWKIR